MRPDETQSSPLVPLVAETDGSSQAEFQVVQGEEGHEELSMGDCVPTGFTHLDEALDGGLPVGSLACIHGTSGAALTNLAAYMAARMSEHAQVAAVSCRLDGEDFGALLQKSTDGRGASDVKAFELERPASVAGRVRRMDAKMAALEVVELAETAAEHADVVVVDGAWELRALGCSYDEFDRESNLEDLLQEVVYVAGALLVVTRREWWTPLGWGRQMSARDEGYDLYLDESLDDYEAGLIGRPPVGMASLSIVDRWEGLWHPPLLVAHFSDSFRNCIYDFEVDWRPLPCTTSTDGEGL